MDGDSGVDAGSAGGKNEAEVPDMRVGRDDELGVGNGKGKEKAKDGEESLQEPVVGSID